MRRQTRIGRTLLSLITLVLLSLPAFQVRAQAPSASKTIKARLTVSGSSTLSPLVSDIARRFEGLHPGVEIDVESGGTGKGVTDVRAGTADIGMVARPLLTGERDLFSFPIARDGVAVVVHRDNPVKAITAAQLSELLTGRLVNWKTLGGRDAPVNLAWRSPGQGSAELILERLNLKREQIRWRVDIGANTEAIKFAAGEPNGITLVSVGEAERNAHAGVPIKLLAYDGVQASSRSIQNHSYLLSRPLTLLTRHLPQGLQKQFIDYALSDRVVDLQIRYGFVPYQE